jgi:polysaccharide export outer membrane protein
MGRTQAFLLRLCVLASALLMLVLSLRAVRAEDLSPTLRTAQLSNAPDPGQVYGYNPGQGLPRSYPQPVSPPEPAPVRLAAPQFQPLPPPQPAPYGYHAGDGMAGSDRDDTQYDPQAGYQAAPSSAMPRPNADYRLGPGDKLRVTVYGEADLSGEYQIDGAGIVRLPLIGSLRAAGTTAPGLEAWIGDALAKGYLKNPRVNVEITTYRPFYIIGAVSKPGEYPYVDHISALNAVALAGGFLDTARQSAVFVRHEGSATEQEVPTDRLTELRPGDTVRVQTTWFWQAMQIFTPLTPAVYAASNIR